MEAFPVKADVKGVVTVRCPGTGAQWRYFLNAVESAEEVGLDMINGDFNQPGFYILRL